MAVMLKNKYNIVVLRVEVLPQGPTARFTLQAKVQGALTNVREWRSNCSDLGIQGDRRPTGEPKLPDVMVAELTEWFQAEAGYGQALWIHLVKPYGMMRFIPWERAFGEGFVYPIIMLPDFIFPPPRESSATLDVAVCASAPLRTEEAWVRDALINTVGRILDASVRRTHIHVFTDAQLAPEIENNFSENGKLLPNITLYDAKAAAPYASADPTSRLLDKTGQLRSPWLLWMREALQKHSIDVVHFVGHGYLARDRGALLFAQSPLERTDDYRAGPVGSMELSTFLTQTGAWATAFSAVRHNNSEPGLRALADEIAQSRPGPMLMQVVDQDNNQESLTPAYNLLFNVQPQRAPISRSLFIYCQPYRVVGTEPDVGDVPKEAYIDDAPGAPPDGVPFAPQNSSQGSYGDGKPSRRRGLRRSPSPFSRNEAQSASIDESHAQESPLAPVFESDKVVMPWVAATERVAEQAQLRLQTRARDNPDAEIEVDPRNDVTRMVLDSLRQSVADYVAADRVFGQVFEPGEQVFFEPDSDKQASDEQGGETAGGAA